MSSKFYWIFVALLGASSSPAANNPSGVSPAPDRSPPAAAPSPTPAEAYQNFVAQTVSPENLADLVAKMDTVVDEVDSADGGSGLAPNASQANSKSGLHLEFSVIRAREAIMYYAGLSRINGEPFRYQEAAMVLSLFCDRVGLPHPIQIKEGEKPVFHAQWLIKPTDWKVLRKKMLEVRTANRAEKNLFTAIQAAVSREATARADASQSASRIK